MPNSSRIRDQHLAEVGGLARVQPGRRLVEAKQLGLGAHGARDLEPALLAIGQVGGIPVGPLGQLELVQPEAGTLERPPLGAAIAGEAEHAEHGVARSPHQRVVLRDDQVLEHAHLAEQADVLKGARDAGAGDPEALDLLEQDLLAVNVEGQLADGRLVEAGQAVEHGGLAGAIRADDRCDLALIRGERKVVDRHQTTKAHGEVVDLEQGR